MLTAVVEIDYNAARKEARGSPLFSYLNGVQVVAGSNPATPTFHLQGKRNNEGGHLGGWGRNEAAPLNLQYNKGNGTHPEYAFSGIPDTVSQRAQYKRYHPGYELPSRPYPKLLR